MADFEADKTSGTGPALVMVHPLKVNDTEADKKAILTITVNGVPKTVNLIQKKGSLNYEYKLEVDKEAINILGKGGSDTLAITSQRREMINGTPQGDWENVEVTAEFLEEPPFTAGLRFTDNEEKTLEVSITSKNHTEQLLSGTITIKQVGGLTKTVIVTQAAGEVTYSYTIEPHVNVNLGNTGLESSSGFTVTGYKYKYIEGKEVDKSVAAFKIPTIGEQRVVNNSMPTTSTTTYWVDGYGSIANTFMSTFSGTAHARQNQPAISSISGGWDVEFSDGGKGQFSVLAVRSL
jgi:hypothetical protein